MAKYEIFLPAMGEGIIEATITKLLKKEGDSVEEEDSIMEIATDKVDSEIPAPISGIIAKILFEEGDVPKVGDLVAIVTTDGENIDDADASQKKEEAPIERKEPQFTLITEAPEKSDAMKTKTENGNFISPLVRTIAKSENITNEELNTLVGSGESNRITKKDILQYIEDRKTTKVIEPAVVSSTPAPQISPPAHNSYTGQNVEIIEMDRMRKLISNHMTNSLQVSAHVTSFIDVDVTPIVQWRDKVKNNFLKKHNQKLTYTPIFVEAVTKAIQDYPLINVSVDGDRIIRKNFVNIGMATALPNGNLIVPVIKDANEKNLIGLSKSVNDLANRARMNQLKPDDIQGSTFTITNLGAFGSTTGTPIINQPEVAILAVGAIKKKPAVIETPLGDTIGIRHIMVLSLSYDHRVVDGGLGGMFLKRVAENLENFDTTQLL
ncbi:2-oxo acid dehydrogenase subunit E2 [Ancylomarina euxinus]|uniref:Dihydrolipoamide acetyltransferase component of pyruvate dehydrogenase complex n=1 Tax=Ancylomarina euxinus TaxID=2283627 RepID=A0A425Y5H0_9BACT|nr:dihydrolipoamide acetyltransferase family protein [Ancylomarina euxinus]MCZ4694219.1 dihydrolipoamide acetyltransferase family protein [Ancylomarina euxinus]MUP14450.1 2-oxo acid dehydrogenase subunit E2 [Ancylomarina euxinus]RRG23753.1 2-oxo acid dehydrogenase subunit E2 [Ancylomarina euxinus]